MSVFGNADKDGLLYEINDFLETYNISELMDVVKWAVEEKEIKSQTIYSVSL